jgi:hypothetical protein
LIGVVGIASMVMAGESPYQAPQEPPQFVFCTALRSQHELPDETIAPATIYYSGVFEGMPSNLRTSMDAYLAYLQKTYSFEPEPGANPVACTGLRSRAEADNMLKIRLDQAKKKPDQRTFDTGWTPSAS